MTIFDEVLAANHAYADRFAHGELPMPPARKLAVVTCMDARVNPYGLLGLGEGDAHVIRNAGGVVTDDVLRSLAISQRLLGTRAILVIHHTDCGMLTFRDDELKDAIAAETGLRPPFALEAFPEVEEDVRQSLRRIAASPWLPHKDRVAGYVFEVESGRLREVADGPRRAAAGAG